MGSLFITTTTKKTNNNSNDNNKMTKMQNKVTDEMRQSSTGYGVGDTVNSDLEKQGSLLRRGGMRTAFLRIITVSMMVGGDGGDEAAESNC